MYLINKKQEHLYRPNVGCVLIKGDRIFVAKRLGYTADAWQMPQGGVDGNEQFEEALLRELNEEIGTDNIDILQKSSYFRYYKVPSKVSMQAWGGRYIGQKQQWFLAKFKGEDAEINIQTKIPEFEEWQWSSPTETVHRAVFFKKDIYMDVLSEFNLY
jgi:putative (di)nucleoside polyphosphate hydrolase